MVAKRAKQPPGYNLNQAQRDVAGIRNQLGTPQNVTYLADQSADLTVTPGAGVALYSVGGVERYDSSVDGNIYLNGKTRVKTTGTQSVTSSSPVTVTGLVIPVGVGMYSYETWVWFNPNTATYGAYIWIGGTCTVSLFHGLIQYTWNSGAIVYDQTTFGSQTGKNSGILATGRDYLGYLKGSMTVSAAGQLQIGAATTGGNGFTTYTGSIFELEFDN